MMKIVMFLIFVTFSLTSAIKAEEVKCKTFDIGCKTKKFLNETKEFQKKSINDGKNQIKKIPENLKQK